MKEGMTIRDFFQWGVYMGAKQEKKKALKKKIQMLLALPPQETYEEMKQLQWTLEVYSKLLLPKAVI